jgi:hypothetical protein
VLLTFLQSTVRENAQPSQMSFYVFGDLIDCTVSIDFFYLLLLLVEINHWLGLIIENLQSLDNRFLIVIRSPTCFASLEQPSLELLLSTIEVEHGFQVHPLCHNFLPNVHVFLSSGEAVEQIPASVVIPLNFFLYDFDHELTRD